MVVEAEKEEEVLVLAEMEEKVVVEAEKEEEGKKVVEGEVVAEADWVQEGLKDRTQMSPFHEYGWLQCGPFQV